MPINIFGDTLSSKLASEGTLVSKVNSTITPLLATEEFVGPFENVSLYSEFTCIVDTDQEGDLFFEVSQDGRNVSISKRVKVVEMSVHTLVITGSHLRVRFVNGSVNQSFLRIQSTYARFKGLPLTSTSAQVISDQNDVALVRNVSSLPHDISRGLISSTMSVHKNAFGIVNDTEQIINSATNPFLTTAQTLFVQSTSANDDLLGTGARSIRLFGLDENFDPISEVCPMDGLTAVETVNTFIRLHFAFCTDVGTYGAGNEGEIYISDAPDLGFATMLHLSAGHGQSESSLYTVPRSKTAFLTNVSAYVDSSKTGILKMHQRERADITSGDMACKRIIFEVTGISGRFEQEYQSLLSFGEFTDIWLTGQAENPISLPISVSYDISVYDM